MRTRSFIESLQAIGLNSFTTNEFQQKLNISDTAVAARLRRLRKSRQIATPYSSFHVIIPPRYRQLGCIPPELFIDDLMKYLEKSYYVGLLTSARYYGATHQIPMSFQVMVPTQQPNIQCGKVFIQFITFGQMSLFPSISRKNDAGFFQLASPETIVLEMMGYPEHCGYWNNVLAVLDELKEQVSLEKIKALFPNVPTAWLQRLGYFSAFIEYYDLADLIEQHLEARRIYPIALATWMPTGGEPTDQRWKVILNTELEMDI